MNSTGGSSPPIAVAVENLSVEFAVRRGGARRVVRAVRGISLSLTAGTTIGLVGESGSGKSTLARALLRLIESEGVIRVDGVDVSTMSRKSARGIAKRMQMVFQDPYSSLNPSLTIADSVAEPLKVHTRMSRAARRARVVEVLALVGLAGHFADRYPDELSGGQRQRVAIARAIVLDPEVLICDEAVSALDVSTQNQVINLLEELRDRIGLAYLFISHDLAVVRHISDQIAVMYLGEIVEEGPADRVFGAAAHPYTQALLDAAPVPDPVLQRSIVRVELRGDIPDPSAPPPGCSFHTRCPFAMPICATTPPPVVTIPAGGTARCHLHATGPRLAGRPVSTLKQVPPGETEHPAPAGDAATSIPITTTESM